MRHSFLLAAIAITSSFPIYSMDTVPVISVGLMNQDRLPYFSKGHNSEKPTGAYIDILNRISKETGLLFEYKFLPQARIRHYMKNQILDIEPGIAKEWRQESGEPESSVYTDIFYKSEETIAYNPTRFQKSNMKASDFSELSPCSIVGFNNIDFDDHEHKDSYDNAKELRTENQIINMLKLNRCDYAVFPVDVIQKELDSGILKRTNAVAYYNLRFRFTKKNEHLVPIFNKVIRDMKTNGEIKKLIRENQR